VILIKPTVDASDKQIYATNGYRTAAKNMVSFMESDQRNHYIEQVFVPKQLGDFSNNVQGVVKTLQNHRQTPSFHSDKP